MKIRIGTLRILVREALGEVEELEVTDTVGVRPVSDEEGTLVPESIVRKQRKR